MKGLASILAVATVLLFAAAPARAQTAPKATLNGPGEGQAVQGTVHLHAEGSADLGIQRLEITIEGIVVAETEPSTLRRTVSLDYDWATTAQLGGGGLSRNGRYTIKVTATARGGGSSTEQRTVVVDNPAVQPTGLSVEVADGTVNLSWSANPEPDLQGYFIQRDDGTGVTTVAQTNETFASDQPPAGDWTYFVSALRYSAITEVKQSTPVQSSAVHVEAAVATEGPGEEGTVTEGGGTGTSPSGATGSGGNRSKNGKVGSVPVKAYGVKGKRLSGTIGLTGFGKLPALSGLTSLPRLPEAQDAVMAWGTYDEQLPYELQEQDTSPRIMGSGVGTEQTSWILVPPDGLRWVALGLLFVAASALLRVLAIRLRFYQPS